MNEIHDFNESNEIGKILEDIGIRDIGKIYPSIHKYLPNNGDYDLFIDEINEGVECKNDVAAARTVNICIEFGQDGRESGIVLTKAKFWLHYDQTNLYLALTDEIRKLINAYDEYWKGYNKTIEEEKSIIEYEKNAVIKYGEMYDDISKTKGFVILKQLKFPEEQNGYTKLMDWYLIPKTIFKKYCLEVNLVNDMTYKNLK